MIGLAVASILLLPGGLSQSPDPYPVVRVEVAPMAINFEQFFQAIVSQESGGNYSAVGVPTRYGRAYGKYQVLEGNIAPWTSKYYGKSLTANQFLNNPKAQDAVARGQLKAYWDKYGARGAAAAWYGGPGSAKNHMSTSPQQGGPSIKGYVDSVLSKAEGMSGGGGGDSGGSGGGGGGVTPSLDPKELAEQYGFAANFLNSNKELKKLFESAVAGGWSKDMFQAKLRDTTWFKTIPADERKYLLETYADPATAQARWDLMNTKVLQMARKLGIRENEYTWAAIHEATRGMLFRGWDESRARYYLGGYIDLDANEHAGDAGEIWDQLHQYAYTMGVKMDDKWYANNSRSVVRGIATIQDFKNEITQMAKAQFPQWNAQIDGGQTVTDIAQPYLQSMAQLLELPAGSVNLFDNTIKKALSYTNSKTLEKGAKPLWQFENELRADPRWKQTKNAQDSLMQVGHKILADFGMAY